MDLADYLLGCAALALALLPWVPAGRRLTRRLLPDETGTTAALAAAVLGVSGVIVVAELVGICDGLRRWPFAVVSAVVATCVARFGRGPETAVRGSSRLPEGRAARVTLACVAVCIVATSASLLGRDVASVSTGPSDLDSLHYHLTQAAHMVQTHNIDHLHHSASSDITAYYPLNGELLDAVGMLGPHPDLAIFALNLLFGWLALLACWVIGARWSRGAPALAAGAAGIALPIVAGGSSGPGLNDLPTIAFVLSAVAFLAVAGVPRGTQPRRAWLTQIAIAGAALGLAAGTKLNVLALVVLVALGTVVLATGDRRLTFLALAAPAVLTGGFWYVRDWIEVGSPVPDLNLTVAGHGFHLVPYPEVQPTAFTVAHYLGNYSVIRHWFIPGLHVVWTGLWPVVALAVAAGVGVALTDRSWLRRVLGVAIVISFVAYLGTPSTALGNPGEPVLFATNTRYALPLIVLGLVLFATSSRLRRLEPGVTAGFTVLTLALIALYPGPQDVRFLDGLAVAIVLGLAVVGVRQVLLRRTAGATGLVAVIVAVAVVGAGAVVQHHYVARRYVAGTSGDKLFTAIGHLHHTRIGLAGYGLGYPLFGRDLSNAVNYVAVSAPSHAFEPPATCAALLEVLSEQRDRYVVVDPVSVVHSAAVAGWISDIPGATVVFRDGADLVYQLPTVIPSDGCATATPH